MDKWVTRIDFCFLILNSAFNLPLYLIFSQNMRKTLRKILLDVYMNTFFCIHRSSEEDSHTCSNVGNVNVTVGGVGDGGERGGGGEGGGRGEGGEKGVREVRGGGEGGEKEVKGR